MALRQEPGLAGKIKADRDHGGAVASLPDGAGNITPNAEFTMRTSSVTVGSVLGRTDRYVTS
jgi:hypothetical protein